MFAPLFFWVLFVSMRQDLRLHLLLVEKVNLEARCEGLRQQLRAEQRDLAVRADLGRIAGSVERRGLRAPEREQVLALVDEPQAVESERPLPLALLEMLSGAADVHASPSSSAGSDRLAREATAAEGGGTGE